MSARTRTAIDLVRRNVTWGAGFGDSPFFEGEVEPCINGRVVALGAYFGERSDRLVDRLLSEQLMEGGWNCEAPGSSLRSSFHTTICVLEGLLAFEEAFGATSLVTDARRRAEEYLLERRLLRRLSTGDIIKPEWTRFAFPTLWHYDLLRALDYLRAAGVRAGTVGVANRWITLRALRVLDWCARTERFSHRRRTPSGYLYCHGGHDAKRIDIRSMVHVIAGCLLWSHIGRRTQGDARRKSGVWRPEVRHAVTKERRVGARRESLRARRESVGVRREFFRARP
ncbi:MAG TPA: hypothetical protein VHE78_10360 [Gemmatimonadaceae bacterium]|nr:hypothetical protein [Gemmatimonadaceae bacterium]